MRYILVIISQSFGTIEKINVRNKIKMIQRIHKELKVYKYAKQGRNTVTMQQIVLAYIVPANYATDSAGLHRTSSSLMLTWLQYREGTL